MTDFSLAATNNLARRLRRKAGFIAFLTLFTADTTGTVMANEERKACDLEALKKYPMSFAIARHAVPIGSPETYFKEEDNNSNAFNFEYFVDAEGVIRNRQALMRGLASYPEIERPILMLVAASEWTSAPDGLLTFFVLKDSIYVDDLLAALDAEGLKSHADLIREGKSYFGSNYGTHRERYERWNKGEGNLDEAFEARFDDLTKRFRKLPRLLDEAVKRIEASPELTAIYEPIRTGMPEEVRFRRMAGGIFACIDPYDDVAAVRARLADLPKAYAQIMAVKYFQDEMLNGSVHQAFFNSSGNLMPEVEAALTEWGLTEQAAAVRKGIEMFPKPYLSDLEERRNFMATQGEDFDNALYDLTGPVDDGAMHDAMLRVARENDIIPK